MAKRQNVKMRSATLMQNLWCPYRTRTYFPQTQRNTNDPTLIHSQITNCQSFRFYQRFKKINNTQSASAMCIKDHRVSGRTCESNKKLFAEHTHTQTEMPSKKFLPPPPTSRFSCWLWKKLPKLTAERRTNFI